MTQTVVDLEQRIAEANARVAKACAQYYTANVNISTARTAREAYGDAAREAYKDMRSALDDRQAALDALEEVRKPKLMAAEEALRLYYPEDKGSHAYSEAITRDMQAVLTRSPPPRGGSDLR